MKLVTSESVSIGHPDKVADQISDAVLDHCLSQDPESHVAVETLCTTNKVVVAGEVSTKADMSVSTIDALVRGVVKDIGYDFNGFDYERLHVENYIHAQSSDIQHGVNERDGHEQGAGDQGIMFGYAEGTEETQYMPIPIYYANKVMAGMTGLRRTSDDGILKPDAKCQLTFDMEDEANPRLKCIVVSQQHSDGTSVFDVRDKVEQVIFKAIPERYFGKEIAFVEPDEPIDYAKDVTYVYVNPAGPFVIGGPDGDTGLTGRKLIVDQYGSAGKIGGGAFSGKDPSKVDRSAAYMCRNAARWLVSRGECKKCEVSVAYAIGVAHPLQVMVDTFGTGDDKALTELVRTTFDFRPKQITEFLGLKKPDGWSYRQTAQNGHFGHPNFPWENW